MISEGLGSLLEKTIHTPLLLLFYGIKESFKFWSGFSSFWHRSGVKSSVTREQIKTVKPYWFVFLLSFKVWICKLFYLLSMDIYLKLESRTSLLYIFNCSFSHTFIQSSVLRYWALYCIRCLWLLIGTVPALKELIIIL